MPLQSTLTQHTEAVTDLSLHAKSKYLASMSADATFCIWDIQEARCMAQVGAQPFAAWAVAICQPSKRCQQLKLWVLLELFRRLFLTASVSNGFSCGLQACILS